MTAPLTPAEFARAMVPLDEQIKEVRREIAMRESVYPRWVSTGKMTQRLADSRLEAMREVERTLAAIPAADLLEPGP